MVINLFLPLRPILKPRVMNLTQNRKTRIALFASGTGSNVFNIITHFKKSESIEVAMVLANKSSAGALKHAENAKIKSLHFNRVDFFETDNVLDMLKAENIDYIILAGFLWKIPQNILNNFKDKILNVHPSLLPKYGGKGMYGHHVHNAVLENKETETGITIHVVNEKYDDGAIVAQGKCVISNGETLETLQKKISQLEKEIFPITIEQFIKNN